MRSAISSFRCAVFPIASSGSSSIVPMTTAAPYVFASAHTAPNFSSPSSRFVELMMHFPGACLRPSSMTSACVESIISGTLTCWAYLEITSRMSATPSRPT